MLLAFAAPTITTNSLLNEYGDLSLLAKPPVPAYITVQHSSYDRASVKPGIESWFANGDYGKYIRSEQVDGRTEWVMADFKGPGACVRFWSANPMGTVRFYFDGETTPRIQAPMVDLLDGKVKGFGYPFAYESAKGHNMYYPLPFAKSLKVTVADGERLNGLYYHVDTKLYTAGTNVETFDAGKVDLDALARASARVSPSGASVGRVRLANVKAGAYHLTGVAGRKPGAITEFTVVVNTPDTKGAWTDPKRLHNILKHIEVVGTFDGQESISAPLPDFLGSGILPADFETAVAGGHGGVYTFRLPMPYRRSASIKLLNHNAFPVMMATGIKTSTLDSPYHLHTRWSTVTGQSRPFFDMVFANFAGRGRYVGTALHIQNSTRAWWGEGDEKVWVDGEKFPSWFGTGTEDYFSYAWSNPEKYERPFHAQPRADGPGCGGQIANVRWHVTDDIPFTKSIKFELERWHWQDVPATFSGTAFWYAEPTAWTAPRVKVKNLFLTEYQPAKPVAGAIEGEKLPVAKTGGTTEVQGFDDLSSGEQLWWRDAREGETLTLTVNVPKAGTYEVVGNLCHARDYGVHTLTLGGQPLGRRDFYSADLKWKKVSLGTVTLPAGAAALVVKCDGHNEKAEPRHMFGLDYLKLVAK